MSRFLLPAYLLAFALSWRVFAVDADRDPAWANAAQAGPLTAGETRAFMHALAQYALAHHLKKTEGSPQRGMMYEYFHVKRAGEADQFIQGEALDTMHDGAWFAIAMAQAYRATGDAFYKEVLTRWQMPFYLAMLNHSDTLFPLAPDDSRPGSDKGWRVSPEWLLQPGEKGFVPYWWDDGGSASLEMTGAKEKDFRLGFPGHNALAGQPNPGARLSGYSYGSSNHLAQDLALLLQQTWLLFHGSTLPAEQALAKEIAEAAQHLEECRTRHGSPAIPAVLAALAVSGGDPAVRAKLAATTWESAAKARSDYRRAFYEYKEGEPVTVPGFADDQEYSYHVGLAREGTLAEPLAFRLVFDAFTLPKLYQTYSDDAPVPPGIGVFDLHPYKFVNGRPTDFRSERKGPGKGPRPVGSRFGPQNMVVCGWALQALQAHPGLWAAAREKLGAPAWFPVEDESAVEAALRRELGAGLRTWQAVFAAKGYIPTGMGAGNCPAGFPWEELSDNGGYAHLIHAAAQWLNVLGNKRDWELQFSAPRP